MQAVVVQHVPFEGPGLIAPALAEAGADVRVVRMDRHEPLPPASQVDVLVVLAASLGARVSRGPAIEVGTGTVTLTSDGLNDPVFGPYGPELPVVHWHQDTFELPEGGVLLASSAQYAHQAFRVGESYGVQFHVELDADALGRVTPYLPAGAVVAPDGARAVASVGERMLKRWAEHALTAAGQRQARR